MNTLKSIFRIAMYKIHRWRTNYRVWFIAIYVIFFIYEFTQNLPAACKLAGEKAGPWLMPFLFSNSSVLDYFLMPFVILFCDAPFLDSTQPYIIVRSRRGIWAWGQVAYIAVSSFLYTLYITLISIIINWKCIEPTLGWGALIEDPDANNFLVSIEKGRFHVHEDILQNFTPLKAMLFSSLLFCLAGILIGLLIFCLNSVTSSRVLGTVFAAFHVSLVSIVYDKPLFYPVAPISWAMITNIFDKRWFWRFTSPEVITAVYFALGAVLITAIMIHNRRRIIEVLPPV